LFKVAKLEKKKEKGSPYIYTWKCDSFFNEERKLDVFLLENINWNPDQLQEDPVILF
jgi:hypothetical protein